MQFNKPLAELVRPQSLEEFIGQSHILAPQSSLYQAIENDDYHSFILWGPPGSGKTTIAHIIRRKTAHGFQNVSAVTSGVKEIRQIADNAQRMHRLGKRTILFVDEIHHFNKSQQDAFLPFVESGVLILIGTTTENPSFELNSPLLSRVKVYPLYPLSADEMKEIIHRAVSVCRELWEVDIQVDNELVEEMVASSDGDCRNTLNFLELFLKAAMTINPENPALNTALLQSDILKKMLKYDKAGDEHYNLISAFHKSLRGSDINASLYWLMRMIEGGENPHYLLRRLMVVASEDVGLADPQALVVVNAARQAFDFLGEPEGYQAIVEATIYLATAPKSNSVYMAMNTARRFVQENRPAPVPLHLRNAPTRLMKEMDYGKEYLYPHDDPKHYVLQEYFPSELDSSLKQPFYKPGPFGFEKNIKNRIQWWQKISKEKKDAES